jgi:hypothetical protein
VELVSISQEIEDSMRSPRTKVLEISVFAAKLKVFYRVKHSSPAVDLKRIIGAERDTRVYTTVPVHLVSG